MSNLKVIYFNSKEYKEYLEPKNKSFRNTFKSHTSIHTNLYTNEKILMIDISEYKTIPEQKALIARVIKGG